MKKTIFIFFILFFAISIGYYLLFEKEFAYNIHSHFYRLLYGDMFRDTYFDNQKYDFKENPEVANNYFQKSLKSTMIFFQKKVKADISYKKLISKNISIDKTLQNNLTKNGIILFYTVLEKIQSLCNKNSLYQLNDENLIAYKVSQVITKENYDVFINKIWSIDQRFLEVSLQKKPDAIFAIQLRIQLALSTCRPLVYQKVWNNALSYLEYKEKKRLYEFYKNNFTTGKLNFILENIDEEALENLSKDKEYLFFLQQSSQYAIFSFQNIELELESLWSKHTYTQNNFYLEQYVVRLRDYLPFCSLKKIQKFYSMFLKLKDRKEEFSNSLQYLYTLVLLEYYSNRINSSMQNIDILLQKINRNDKQLLKEIMRLRYLIILKLKS